MEGPLTAPTRGAFAEFVLGEAQSWRDSGKKIAVLTLYNVEPTGPRPTGSQMAVSDTGDFVGFLSGGCVEGALVEEAVAAMAEGKNRSIRYGVNSPYFDIELPCGSAIDVFIDTSLSAANLDALVEAEQHRTPMLLSTDMATGESMVTPFDEEDQHLQLQRSEIGFERLYRPTLRLVVAGKGPALVSATQVATASGMQVHVITTEDETAAQCVAAGATTSKTVKNVVIDAWTAVATLFHEHELENPVLAAALDSNPFYIGALGSRNTHAERCARLLAEGCDETDVERIKGPLGISIGSRNPPEIAISMIAEIFQVYRARFPV